MNQDLLTRAIPYALRAIERELLLLQRQANLAATRVERDRLRALRAELIEARGGK